MTMREKFEKWIANEVGYVDPPIGKVWEMWQAAYRAGQTAAVKAVEDAGGDNTDYHVAAIRAILADNE
jgi:hypothetical protein